jgi:hypothetical protein
MTFDASGTLSKCWRCWTLQVVTNPTRHPLTPSHPLPPLASPSSCSLLLSLLSCMPPYKRSSGGYRHVAYEEPHIPLFAAPAFQNVSRRGHYGDAVQQMDNSVGTVCGAHTTCDESITLLAVWSGQIIAKLKSTGLDANTSVLFLARFSCVVLFTPCVTGTSFSRRTMAHGFTLARV